MKVALDIDGVVDRLPSLLAILTSALRLQGHKIVILTSRLCETSIIEQSLREIREAGIHFDDYFFLPNATSRQSSDFPADLDWYQRQIWQKAEFCANNDIDVFFEDEEKVVNLVKKFSPGTVVLKVV